MSLICAHKTSFGIRILSDSKLTVEPNDKDILKTALKPEEFNNITRYGIIKTVIYKPTITISFAGVLEYFNELLEYLKINNVNDIEEILKIATSIHNKHDRDVDFIITSKQDIYEIKEGKYEKVDFCWIGDKDAFSKFQEQKSNYVFDDRSCSPEEFTSEEINSFKEIDTFNYALQKVIDSDCIDTVGGFMVICAISFHDDSEYEFLSRIGYYSGFDSKQTLKHGDNIIFYHKVDDGGFRYHILDSRSNFLIYLKQIELGIVYKNGYSDKKYCNLSLPFLVHCSYEEFLDKYSDVEQSIQTN